MSLLASKATTCHTKSLHCSMAEYPARGIQSSAGASSSQAGPSGQEAASIASLNQPQQGYPAAPLPYSPEYLQPGDPQPADTAQGNQNQLRHFWQKQINEIHQVSTDPTDFKNHQLPLARIKKIMKSDEDVRMISAEAPVLFAKACEMFILELTIRSWDHSEENKRRTLQRNDISAAITRTDIFDFLVDIVPRDEQGDDGPSPRPQAMPAAFPSQSQAGQPAWPLQAQQAQQPAATVGIGDLPPIPRPQQAVDPAVMQFYMQQPQNLQHPGAAMPNLFHASQIQGLKDQEAIVAKTEPRDEK